RLGRAAAVVAGLRPAGEPILKGGTGMAKLLITGTHGAEDPTRASMPFHVAKGAKEAGHDVDLVLANDAPVVPRNAGRDTLPGAGLPPLKDLVQFVVDNKLRVYV